MTTHADLNQGILGMVTASTAGALLDVTPDMIATNLTLSRNPALAPTPGTNYTPQAF